MNSLYAKVLTQNEAEAELLDCWLRERVADLDAAENPVLQAMDCGRVDEARLRTVVDGYDPEIAPGQIRILSRIYTSEPDAIAYVVVLEKADEGKWIVAPFSQYSFPATAGEMVTGIRFLGLRVIQAWNGRVVQERLLQKSYCFGLLDDKVVANAKVLYRNQVSGTPLPEGFNVLTGSDVLCEADPRCDYLTEAVDRLRPLSTAVHVEARLAGAIREQIEQSLNSNGFIWRPAYSLPDALAAGGKEVQRTEVFTVKETDLSVTYSPEDQVTIFTFYDRNDEPDVSYDGYGLVGAGEFLGTFHDGTLCVPSASVKDWYQIVDREGREVMLARK